MLLTNMFFVHDRFLIIYFSCWRNICISTYCLNGQFSAEILKKNNSSIIKQLSNIAKESKLAVGDPVGYYS